MIAVIKLAWLLPVNAFFPVDISYNTEPKAKMSVRASTSFPSSCSGGMYWHVPIIVPSAVRLLRSVGNSERTMTPDSGARNLAKPKSSSLAPDFVSIMLPGFKSRCTTPCL